ncbi:MAG: hypothetical protein QOJ89_2498 [bacterium]
MSSVVATVIRVLVLAALAGIGVVFARMRMDLELGPRVGRAHDRRWWLVAILAYAPIPLVVYAFGRVVWAI